MLLTAEFLKNVFSQGLTYQQYVGSGNETQQESWQGIYEKAALSDEQTAVMAGFVREMNVLVVSGLWCGDCVEQCPLIARVAEGSEKVHLRFVDRDSVPELRDNVKINAGNRVPVALFMAEDFAPCGWYGDRTLGRYRKLAEKQLGPSCSTGLFTPEEGEMAMTQQEWMDEFERIQLMLRLSTRLRQLHGD